MPKSPFTKAQAFTTGLLAGRNLLLPASSVRVGTLPTPFESPQKKAKQTPIDVCFVFGGERGIRTLGTLLYT